MADQDFNFDEFLSEPEEKTSQKKASSTNASSNTANSDNTEALHPFSARLDERYIEIIKALAWWKRISQREFIEKSIELALRDMSKENLNEIIYKYKKKQ